MNIYAPIRKFTNVFEYSRTGDFPTIGKTDLELRSLYLLAAPSTPAEVIRTLGKRAVHDIIEIGRRLIDAKERGNWLQWIKDEFGWSRQTADNELTTS